MPALDVGVSCAAPDDSRVKAPQIGIKLFCGNKKMAGYPKAKRCTQPFTNYSLTFGQIKPAKINLSLFGRLVEGGLG